MCWMRISTDNPGKRYAIFEQWFSDYFQLQKVIVTQQYIGIKRNGEIWKFTENLRIGEK